MGYQGKWYVLGKKFSGLQLRLNWSALHTEKSFEIVLNQTQIRLYLSFSNWSRTANGRCPFDVPNQSVYGKYNLIWVWFNKISKIFLWVHSPVELSFLFRRICTQPTGVEIEIKITHTEHAQLMHYLSSIGSLLVRESVLTYAFAFDLCNIVHWPPILCLYDEFL